MKPFYQIIVLLACIGFGTACTYTVPINVNGENSAVLGSLCTSNSDSDNNQSCEAGLRCEVLSNNGTGVCVAEDRDFQVTADEYLCASTGGISQVEYECNDTAECAGCICPENHSFEDEVGCVNISTLSPNNSELYNACLTFNNIGPGCAIEDGASQEEAALLVMNCEEVDNVLEPCADEFISAMQCADGVIDETNTCAEVDDRCTESGQAMEECFGNNDIDPERLFEGLVEETLLTIEPKLGDEASCLQTGGSWESMTGTECQVAFLCGAPYLTSPGDGTCAGIPTGCNCGPFKYFKEGAGCVEHEYCFEQSIRTGFGDLCTETGGVIAEVGGGCDLGYLCGEVYSITPGPNEGCTTNLRSGCDCGEFGVFQEGVGCVELDYCYEQSLSAGQCYLGNAVVLEDGDVAGDCNEISCNDGVISIADIVCISLQDRCDAIDAVTNECGSFSGSDFGCDLFTEVPDSICLDEYIAIHECIQSVVIATNGICAEIQSESESECDSIMGLYEDCIEDFGDF